MNPFLRSPTVEAVIKFLHKHDCTEKDVIAETVARELGTQKRIVKAIITKMLKKESLSKKKERFAYLKRLDINLRTDSKTDKPSNLTNTLECRGL